MYIKADSKLAMQHKKLISIVTYLFIVTLNLTSGQQTVKQWKLFQYNFLPQQPTSDVNFYNPTNVLATGIAVSKDRIFVATPKLFSGVPSTLNYVVKSDLNASPTLQAYPDWSFSTTGRNDFNCSELVLVSVYRLRIDSCNRLWVLDSGISRSLEDYEKTCAPKILVIDLNTNQVVRRIDFPQEILRGESLFTNLIVDETTSKSGTCDDVFVYISDTVEPAIVVYDSERDVTWRLTHPAMYPDPDFAQSEILNNRFILMDGVVGLTFDPKLKIIYFQPLATDRIFSVERDVLRAGPIPNNQVLNVKLLGKKSSQGIGLAVSPFDSSVIFSPLSETAIASWNPLTNKQQVLASDKERLQFVADITTTPAEAGVIYAISSKFHRFFLKNLNSNEINNQIIRIQLPDAPNVYQSGALPGAFDFNLYNVNYLRQNQTLPRPQPALNYFSTLNSSPLTHDYNLNPVNVINYSVKNPFTFNQGESFPPTKNNRNNDYNSFLERLAATAPTASPFSARKPQASVSLLPVSAGGYYYTRNIRNAFKTE